MSAPSRGAAIRVRPLLVWSVAGALPLAAGLGAWRLVQGGVPVWAAALGAAALAAPAVWAARAMRGYRLEYDADELREHLPRGVRRLRFADVREVRVEVRLGARAQREHWLVLHHDGGSPFRLRMDDHDPRLFPPLLRALSAAHPSAELDEPARRLRGGA